MTDEQYKSLSDKIEELTQTLKDQSLQLTTENQWLSGVIIFIVSFGLGSLLVKMVI